MSSAGMFEGFDFHMPDEQWLARVRRADSNGDSPSSVLPGHGPSDGGYEIGQRLGPYELVRQIATGGMGTVWMAARVDEHFDRMVAIKLIKRGMDTDEIVKRFRLERQVLATLVHPHIARLYDGGATNDGRPYLVMEHVEGVPILEYCQTNQLDVEQRLQLFGRVCLVVHHAHSNLVLHRDLKPSNILVTAQGDPKLLDFGIAKLLDDGGSAGTAMTATDGRVLTPRYASPEQVRGDRLTTATDVYSLGVVLYELLAGRPPYRLEAGTRAEIERAVLEQEPPNLSLAVQRRDDLAGANRKRLSHRLRGDLDAIAAIALQKEAAGRYQSAEQFAEDVRRHLEGLPLLARRPGLVARTLRLVRRRRGALLAAALGGALSLAIGTLFVMYWFLVPGWFDEHVRAAHLTFVERHTNHAVYNIIFWNMPVNRTRDIRERAGMEGLSPDVQEEALAEYGAALRLSPSNDTVRLERAVLLLADALADNSDRVLELTASLADDIPLTCSYAETSHLDGLIPQFGLSELQAADAADLRCLGLLAMLRGNLETTLDAWPCLQLEEADPLVEASLGNIYLALDEPELAYPRLLSAHRAFPRTGALAVYLADAAVRCGDVGQARLLLGRAADLELEDNSFPVERVRMLCLLAEGDIESAMDLYDQTDLERYNPIATVQLAAHFERSGDDLTALRVLAGRLQTEPRKEQATPVKFARLMEAWWSDLPEQEQTDLSRDAVGADTEDPESFMSLLRSYTVAIASLTQYGEPHPLATRARWTQLARPVDAERLAAARTDLLGLAERLRVTSAEHKSHTPE